MLGVRVPSYTCATANEHTDSAAFRYNRNGQLGLGDVNDRGTSTSQMGDALPFVDLGTGQSAFQVVAGRYHTCAILTSGVKCWG